MDENGILAEPNVSGEPERETTPPRERGNVPGSGSSGVSRSPGAEGGPRTSTYEGSENGSPADGLAERERRPRDPEDAARALCQRLLTGTPRTREQLAEAMRRRGVPDSVAERVLSRLEDAGMVDDAAFASAWVESRHHGRGLARRALARELRTRGVEGALIEKAVGQLDFEREAATARALVHRRLRATQGLDHDKRLRRLVGMLARKGYTEELAVRVVRQALQEEGEDTE